MPDLCFAALVNPEVSVTVARNSDLGACVCAFLPSQLAIPSEGLAICIMRPNMWLGTAPCGQQICARQSEHHPAFRLRLQPCEWRHVMLNPLLAHSCIGFSPRAGRTLDIRSEPRRQLGMKHEPTKGHHHCIDVMRVRVPAFALGNFRQRG